jgi:hypothetical protein
MRSIQTMAAAALLAATLTACSSSGEPTAGPTASGPAAATGSPTQSATATATATGGSAATTLDPCQLVPQGEAAALAHSSFGPGREETDPGGGKRCIYGYQTHNVFTVIVVQAATVEQAQAEKAKLLADVDQQIGATLNLTHVPGLGDDAVTVHSPLNGLIAVSGVYVLQGTVGFALVDALNGTPPTTAALIAQAQTVLGRLP